MQTNYEKLAAIKKQIAALEKEKSRLETELEVKKTKYEKYLEGYACKELLKSHALNEYGTWRIYGEDPNCDFAGIHSNPYIATVSCTLETAIKYAVELPNFWAWGGGGEIRKSIPDEIINLGR